MPSVRVVAIFGSHRGVCQRRLGARFLRERPRRRVESPSRLLSPDHVARCLRSTGHHDLTGFHDLIHDLNGGFCPAALFVAGKTGGGNFRDHSEAGMQLGLVLGIGFGHDVGAVAGAGTKTDKGWDIAGFSIRFPNIDRTVRVS